MFGKHELAWSESSKVLKVTAETCASPGNLFLFPVICLYTIEGTLPTSDTTCSGNFQSNWINLSNPRINVRRSGKIVGEMGKNYINKIYFPSLLKC